MDPYTQASINKIEMVQRRAVRWVSNNYSSYASVTQMQNNLGWRTLEDRRADARLILQNSLWFGCCSPSRLYLTSKQTDQAHASSSFHPDFNYSQLLQVFVFPSGDSSVESTSPSHPYPPRPGLLQVGGKNTLTLHALNHNTCFYLF